MTDGFDYFYSGEEEQFAFYRVPKVLFTNDRFRPVSTDAKMLYGLMLDRMALSRENGWRDEEGRIFIFYTMEDVREALGVGRQKAAQLLSELDRCGLILRKRQGLGKPNRIYVGRFISPDVRNADFQKYENQTSGSMKNGLQEVWKSYPNNTDMNKTENNKTENKNPSIYQGEPPPDIGRQDGKESKEIDSMDGVSVCGYDPEKQTSVESSLSAAKHGEADPIAEREAYGKIFDSQCDFISLKKEFPYSGEELDGIRDILIDTCASQAKEIRIGGSMKPAAVVKAQLLKLNIEHIRYVMGCLEGNTTKIMNIRQYLLTSLFYAPMTMGSYYQARVNHDMYGAD